MDDVRLEVLRSLVAEDEVPAVDYAWGEVEHRSLLYDLMTAAWRQGCIECEKHTLTWENSANDSEGQPPQTGGRTP